MSTEYLQYIPIITANPFNNAVLLTCVPALLYTLAAYGHLAIAGASLSTSIIISSIFAILEYVVRVPIIQYSSGVAGMSNGTMQFVWVVITLIFGYISGYFMPTTHLDVASVAKKLV